MRQNDRNLTEYLPPFLADYEELNEALSAETPELEAAWEAVERVLKNAFVAAADEYGISRFEKLLRIYPEPQDTLESRRSRVMARWFSELPYTERTLINKLNSLCGERNFSLDTSDYTVSVATSLGLFGQLAELERTLEEMLPANMNAVCHNVLQNSPSGDIRIGGAVTVVITHIINDWEEL